MNIDSITGAALSLGTLALIALVKRIFKAIAIDRVAKEDYDSAVEIREAWAVEARKHQRATRVAEARLKKAKEHIANLERALRVQRETIRSLKQPRSATEVA